MVTNFGRNMEPVQIVNNFCVVRQLSRGRLMCKITIIIFEVLFKTNSKGKGESHMQKGIRNIFLWIWAYELPNESLD